MRELEIEMDCVQFCDSDNLCISPSACVQCEFIDIYQDPKPHYFQKQTKIQSIITTHKPYLQPNDRFALSKRFKNVEKMSKHTKQI